MTTLAATVTGAGDAFAYTDATGLTIGTVDGLNGITTNNGAITVATTTGALTVSNTAAVTDVNAGTSTVALTAGGANQLLTIAANASVSGTGGVTYTADNMTLTRRHQRRRGHRHPAAQHRRPAREPGRRRCRRHLRLDRC